MVKRKIYCDRCGKEKREAIIVTHGFRLLKQNYIIEKWIAGEPIKLDLCQSCYDSFAKWMEAKE